MKRLAEKEDIAETDRLDPENVVYQGRAIVSFLTLVPACILEIKRQKKRVRFVSPEAKMVLARFLSGVMDRAGLLRNEKFLSKGEFRDKGFLGSGGLARFRDSLWAAVGTRKRLTRIKPERLAELAADSRAKVRSQLGTFR